MDDQPTLTPIAALSRRLQRLPPGGWLLLCALWLAGTVLAFWGFYVAPLRAFHHQLVTFDGEQLSQLRQWQGPGITVIHFRDEGCACNRYSEQPLETLKRRYQTADIAFREVTARQAQAAALPVPATPAVAVLSASGDLAYFGPFNLGLLCGADDNYVARVIEQLHAGQQPRQQQTLGVGCFCPVAAANQGA